MAKRSLKSELKETGFARSRSSDRPSENFFASGNSQNAVLLRKASCACGGGCAACQTNGEKDAKGEKSADSTAGVPEAIGSGGRPLDADTRGFFEPRLGYDLGGVRIHTGGTADQSAKAAGARAYTLGSDIVFGSGEYRPDSESGRHLLAHELTHVMQSGINASNPAQTPAPVESLEHEARQVAGAISSGAPMPPVSGSAAGLTVPLKGPDDDGSPTFGNLPRDAPDAQGMKKRVMLVKEGDVWYEKRPDGQKFRAGGTYDFVVQDGKIWAVKGTSQIGKTNPGHTEAAAGNRVEYAGTIKFGSSQAGRGTIREWTNASGHYAPVRDSAEAIAKANGLPWGDGRFKAVDGGFPDRGPQLPVFQPQTRPPAGGTAKVPAGPPRLGALEARIRETNTKPPATATTPPPAGAAAAAPALPVSPGPAKNLLAELNQKQSFVRNMDIAITGVRYALGAWNAYDVLMDALRAQSMALTILNHGSPYWKALQETYAFEADAKEADRYYTSLELSEELWALQSQPGWNSWHQLQQMQLGYLLIEQDLNNSLKSVKGAISDINKQIRDLEEGMADKIIAATWMPVMSLQMGDAMTFADAGGRMNVSLARSLGHYKSAQAALELKRGMARAAAKQLEIRLREIDSTGHVFEDIPTEKLENYPLNKFTFRR